MELNKLNHILNILRGIYVYKIINKSIDRSWSFYFYSRLKHVILQQNLIFITDTILIEDFDVPTATQTSRREYLAVC